MTTMVDYWRRRTVVRVWASLVAICLICVAGYLVHHRLSRPPRRRSGIIRTVRHPLAAEGPGGPILVLSDEAHPFSRYTSEILLTEGFNEFSIQDVTRLTSELLTSYDVVIVGEVPLSAEQRRMVYEWVARGGNLIAMRPDAELARQLGMGQVSGTLSDAYLAFDPTLAGKGLVHETIQFHGTADLYSPGKGEVIATLFRDASTSAEFPAVEWLHVGAGQAVVFTYDLARSVVYTRQGNPAWSGMERDGISPMRSDDLFYGAASKDPQRDWVDLSKVAIPQADEQQRLMANLLLQMNLRKKPLPRFWYFPRGVKAVVIMTGDDHGHGGTAGRFEIFERESPPGCSVRDWQCIRGTSNIFPGSVKEKDARELVNEGFEIGLHVYTGCMDWPLPKGTAEGGSPDAGYTMRQSGEFYSRQLTAFASEYPGLPPPSTTRTDCVTWGDYDSQPQVELQHGIRLDTNYYYWPPKWVRNQPGMFTGSGIPMRFAKRDGSLVDVYQATTQMTDESGQSYPFTVDRLLDGALGKSEFIGAFTANMHTDFAHSDGAEEIVQSAKSRKVPVVSAVQMLRWLDGRDGSTFQEMTWDQGTLRFGIQAAEGSEGLEALLPAASGRGELTSLTCNGAAVRFERDTFAGVNYAMFSAEPGSYVAVYGTGGVESLKPAGAGR